MYTEVLNISGMTSESCSETVAHILKQIDGVARVSASFPHQRAIVEFDAERTAVQEMRAALRKAGYDSQERNAEGGSCGGCCGGCGGKQA